MKLKTLGTVSKRQILFFTKNLAIMLTAGATLPEALHALREQTKGKLQFVIDTVIEIVERGQTLSEGLARYPKIFPPFYTDLLRAGEASGNLDENLKRLGVQLEKNYQLRKKVTGAMIYPSIVIIGGIGLSMGIAVFILPKIIRVFENFKVELPLTTRILIVIARFFQNYGVWAIASVVIGLTFLVWVMRRRSLRPVTHWLILHLPIVKGLSRHYNLAIFCRTSSMLLESGVTIDESVKICAGTVRNLYYKRFLEHTHGQIKAGDSMAAILSRNKNLFPPTDIQIISVGEASGTLSDSLKYCSEIHDEEVDNITKNLATILEPLLLVLIGLMVGFIALSIITPLYSITSTFRR